MNFLRRVFGSSKPPSRADDEVSITENEDSATLPEEPVIQSPDASATPKAPNGDQERLSQADDDTDPLLEENLAAMLGTRPLPRLEIPPRKPGQRLVFGQFSDVGMVRGNNQDAILTMLASSASSDGMPDFGVFIVADGMGGHHDGEKAASITTREQDVLKLLGEGLSNQEIAAELYISLGTVKTHLSNIFNKLDVTSRVQAVVESRALRLI